MMGMGGMNGMMGGMGMGMGGMNGMMGGGSVLGNANLLGAGAPGAGGAQMNGNGEISNKLGDGSDRGPNAAAAANLRSTCKSDLEFHYKKSHRSICPRRRDYNNLYPLFAK